MDTFDKMAQEGESLFEKRAKEGNKIFEIITKSSKKINLEDKLILLVRKYPTVYEIHRGEIDQTKNLILSTSDYDFAERLVNGYNAIKKET